MAKAATAANRPVPDTTAWKNLSGPPRDPKARARSREYLKQCLQEITYLTSPGALNPLPTRAPVQLESAAGEVAAPERPRKSLPEETIPPPNRRESQESAPAQQAEQQPLSSDPEQSQTQEESQQQQVGNVESATSSEESSRSNLPNGGAYEIESKEPPTAATEPPSQLSPSPQTVPLPESSAPPSSEPRSKDVLTAIYRPGDKASWREQLQQANDAANKVPWPPRRTSDEEQLAGLTLVEEEEGKVDEPDGDRIWATRRVLKSHLDIVRGVAVAQGPDLTLATGGDDCTVKVWVLDTPSVMSSSYRPLASSEIEPVATYRGHTLPVTAVAVSTALGVVFSASMDSTIRIWRLATKDDDPYAPYDPSKAIQTLEGHTDVVWDVCLLPAKPASGVNGGAGKPGAESQLVSVSADGSAKLWEAQDCKWALKASFSDFDGATPTCLSVDSHDFNRVLIGLSNGVVKVYTADDGQEVRSFGEPGGSQVNAIISHPTLPMIITGHEDGQLQFYDTKTGTSSPNLLAHPAPITSLALSPLSPMCILSASVDCSVRLWDLQRKTSLQDLTGHRQRSDEGVTHVASHPELPIVASAGADGIVRVWGAG